MLKIPFSYTALALGLPLLVLLLLSAPESAGENPKLPLLMILITSEFGAIVTAIGTITGVMRIQKAGLNYTLLATSIVCGLLSIKFLLIGLSYWPL